MNKIIKQFLIKLYGMYTFIVVKLSNDIISTRTTCNTLIYNKIYIKVFETYKDNTIKKNNEFTKYLYESILGSNPEMDEECKKELDILKEEIISNESKLIAKHHILSAYFDYYISTNSIFNMSRKKNIKNYLKKAKKYDLKVKLLKRKDYKTFKKNIKSELKDASGEIKKLNKERIKSEKEKIIEPLDIKVSYVITFISIVSALSLIGGIIYNQLFFYFLGLNATNFFNLSDYISSSIDVLSIVFISILLGVPFYFLKISHLLDEKIVDEQFGTNIQSKNDKSELKVKWFISITLILGIFIFYYRDGEISFDMAAVLIYLSIIFTLPKLSLWKYIKNFFAVSLAILILLNFLYLIITKAYTQAKNIKNDNYNKEYKIVLKQKTSDDYTFIQSNSNYTFLFNRSSNKIIIIQNSEIEKIEFLPNKTAD